MTGSSRARKNRETAKKLLEKLRAICEVELHNRVYEEFLAALGASNIVNVHGPREFGRDFKFTLKIGLLNDAVLGVCQIKNEKLNNRQATAALEQLLQAKKTQVSHPVTNVKANPREVYFFSTYDLPDMPDCASHLQQVREHCILLTGEQLAVKILDVIPETAYQVLDPNSSLYDAIIAHVRKHHEASAFDLGESLDLPVFFINLGLQVSSFGLQEIINADAERAEIQRSEWIFKPVGLSLLRASTRIADAFGIKDAPVHEVGERAKGDKLHVSYENFGRFWNEVARNLRKEKKLKVGDWVKRVDGLGRICDALRDASAFDLWHAVDSEVIRSVTEMSVPRITPSHLGESSCHISIVAEAGSGKTCFARRFVHQVNELGKRAIYFPCLSFHGNNLTLREAICSFLKELCPAQSMSDIDTSISEADFIVLDACDESPLFGEALGDAIKNFVRPKEFKKKFKRSQKEIGDLVVPISLFGVIEERRLKGKERELVLSDVMSEDEWDELLDANSTTAYESRLRSLKKETRNLKAPRIIITSRSVEQLKLGRQFVTLRLERFTRTQVLDFFSKFLSTSQCQEIKKLLEKDEDIWEICRTPLTATIVVALALNKYDLPRSRSEVYRKRFDLLLERWDRNRNVPKRTSVSAADKMQFLIHLARQLHSRHKRSFDVAFAQKVLSSKLDRVRFTISASQLLEELVAVDNVLYRESEDRYSLGHLSFQEYLTAQAMVMGQEMSALARKYNEEWWRNVCVFFVGITGDATQLITAIQKHFAIDEIMVEKLTREARHTPKLMRSTLRELALDDAISRESVDD